VISSSRVMQDDTKRTPSEPVEPPGCAMLGAGLAGVTPFVAHHNLFHAARQQRDAVSELIQIIKRADDRKSGTLAPRSLEE
jgi:hypothetical protein